MPSWNALVSLIFGNISSHNLYWLISLKKCLVDLAVLRPFKNSSLILSGDTPSRLLSFLRAASTFGSNPLPNLPANLIALRILNLSSPNLSSGSPTVLTIPFLRSSIPPTRSTTSLVSISKNNALIVRSRLLTSWSIVVNSTESGLLPVPTSRLKVAISNSSSSTNI